MALMGVDVSRDRIKAAESSIWDPRDAAETAAVAVFGSSLSLSVARSNLTHPEPPSI